MEDSNFSHQDSLKTIEEMIQVAKGRVTDNSFYFILWGWVILIACLANFILIKMNSPYPFLGWSAVFIGVFGSMFYGMKQGKQAQTKSHLDAIYNTVWVVFGLNYIFFLFWSINTQNPEFISPFICVIAGTATFLSGRIIKFKPLIIGGLLLYAIGFVTALLPEFALLLTAIGMLVGYLVPGYMLKRRK